MAEVQLREIEKRFGGIPVLDRLDLTVSSGQYLVLLGKSGCGKTTTLKILAGLEPSDGGRVTIDGRDMSGVPPRQRNVAMVFQGDALYPHLTIGQTLRVGLGRVVARDELQKRIEEATELLDIEDLLDRIPGELSGGQLRRAAVAKAMVRRGGVRLLDEPLSALDANVRVSLGESLIGWHQQYPGTTIHVTHDGQEAMRIADRIAVIDEGKIVQSAAPQEIYDAPVSRTVALAVGSPLMRFLDAKLVGSCLAFASSEIKTIGQPPKFAAKDSAVSVGMRAASCRLVAGELPDRSGVRITGKIIRRRLIDGRMVLRVNSGSSSIDAESTDRSLAVGEQVSVFVDTRDLHVFDDVTGARLRRA